MHRLNLRFVLAIIFVPLVLVLSGCSSEAEKREEARKEQEEKERGEEITNNIRDRIVGSTKEACQERGYTSYANDVCFRFMDKDDPNYDCGYSSGSCSILEVSPTLGCSSIYVKANIEDASGNILDWTNGTANSVHAEGNALIKLRANVKGQSKMQITELKCR